MSDNRRLVDPELLPLLDRLGSAALDADLLSAARAARRDLPGMVDKLPVVTEARSIPGMTGDPDVRVLISRPENFAGGPLPAILHIHGGGFVMGTPDAALALLRNWAAGLECVVISVDYRLAPETPFPGPLDDCYAALLWTVAEADSLGIDVGRIGVAGESAGGGLAAGLALLAKQRSGPHLAFQNLQYPMLDDRTGPDSPRNPVTGDYLWTREMNDFGWRSFLGMSPGGQGVSPFAAPFRSADLSGLPPAYIGVGTLDLFLDEDIEYAQRMIRASVPVELEVFPGAFHAFELQPRAEVSRRSARRRMDALRRAMTAGENP
ncbi:alpha/beta hydrolase [Acetobacter oeni]|uniref:Esterase n=1 Tax=Acetobacter oeni TaxID=304077 RepID=A0A511XGP3_9PROT|nr:alpha/beta hydrolase [Acetobacter oeni]MBB3881702.1 acetyl esterase/lipase [Acetobacter oeni]NHO17493.1 alpha/beta hydrolase fold domain-containing protein [Acetobacter oeni]GBR05972.1 arylesterase [Acetobacter oeni LMG 21952]GEN62127.1 esterase [Acetobacter oeni]